MTAQQQTESLMNELLGYAERMLGERGGFQPFGGYLKASGEVVHVGVQSSGEHKKVRQKVDALIKWLKAARKNAVAFGVVVDVALPHADGSDGDAIQFLLEHKDGYCAHVFFRYAIDDGKVLIIESIAQEGEPTLFQEVH